MKFKLTLLCVYLFFQISMLVLAQEENLESIGIITKEIIYAESYITNRKLPDLESDLKLYNEPSFFSGKRIVQQWEIRGKGAILFTSIIDENGNKKRPEIEHSSFVWTGYKSFCFQYSEAKDGYLKIKLNKEYYWLNQNEIEQYNFKPILWLDYLTNIHSNTLTANINLNLRAYPSVQASRIKLLEINRYGEKMHYMKMTGKTKGAWAEVEVNLYKDFCGNSKEVPQTLIGWIKVIDNDGSPNIFNVPSPCG